VATKSGCCARMFCDILQPDGKPYEGDPRYILKRNLERLKEDGSTFYLGPELEYFYFKGDRNAFFDQDDEYQLSVLAKGYIAGLFRHAPEITSVTNQWINSYKRPVPEYEAPVYITWARSNIKRCNHTFRGQKKKFRFSPEKSKSQNPKNIKY
jgi:glutamine synthetase